MLWLNVVLNIFVPQLLFVYAMTTVLYFCVPWIRVVTFFQVIRLILLINRSPFAKPDENRVILGQDG
jgi:hypothetical protein